MRSALLVGAAFAIAFGVLLLPGPGQIDCGTHGGIFATLNCR